MRYITDRKRAVGKGSAHTGAEHHWFMIVSSVALAFMMPAWIFIFGNALGSGYDAALATMSRPFPAILTALVLIVGMIHFHKGGRVMIEDYTAGTTRKLLIMAYVGFSYVMIACGLFALVKIAL
ncbi:MAG: succinate dehydrogenase, hydrophobic membrane anchor protein [Salipiger thiooxidans]|jgi:succinate dehydrogenase / fumarate reductase membrane anchor subunit|uniref:succinate dehydrogenase, hydrophobic membrane anchor protein n=1 Tax=Salipiger thiooxidans TaxID=282683 RepID=UPI001A8D22AB|nr:succinate dehydrogenase, hydrophobic membrane anchor protein [Salipiger thiooxidans]MBN8187028.1 succinate dehydrogenase, hydrophobic membrane anchor protein [Salipiger thiooxidans]MBR9838171.1 succinate dehydrogenase, hydrophobic membrane anchor protein [Paracoccaceae bacterium]MCA0846650.1 succinate dehydrogenase, hydrophobic membrane anchor protein [Salipiger thiooxidans]